jgi:hypothetical protein
MNRNSPLAGICQNSNQYTSFDKVLDTISDCGPLSLMGRMDISSAFRLLIINPGDFELFGFKFKDNYYFDNYLPMGCSASCQLRSVRKWTSNSAQLQFFYKFLLELIFMNVCRG